MSCDPAPDGLPLTREGGPGPLPAGLTFTRYTSRELYLFWKCGISSHGHCFSSSHHSANRVAWEAARHSSACRCWRHTVLAEIGWPAVTGQPGSPHVVFEDASLPHQPVPGVSSGALWISCTCLPAGQHIADLGKDDSAMAAYRAWHIEHGELVWP